VIIVRHPMPYGDLKKQSVQRFANRRDLSKNKCTLEEIEEYEKHIDMGIVVFAGVDYERILRAAEREADIVIWDGGNNDYPFYRPDLHVVIADARRPGHELAYHHGKVNVRIADVVVVNKVNTAKKKDVDKVMKNIKKLNPKAIVVKANMTKIADKPELIKGKNVLVVEDGPTLTHGGLSIGAGFLAAKKYGARKIIDPRPYAVGSIKETFKRYPHLNKILPAMGYDKKQMKELEATINQAHCDSIIIGTPIDLNRYLKIKKPATNITYEIHSMGKPSIDNIIGNFLKRQKIRTRS